MGLFRVAVVGLVAAAFVGALVAIAPLLSPTIGRFEVGFFPLFLAFVAAVGDAGRGVRLERKRVCGRGLSSCERLVSHPSTKTEQTSCTPFGQPFFRPLFPPSSSKPHAHTTDATQMTPAMEAKMKELNLPRLTGTSLRIAAYLLRVPILGTILASMSKQQNHFLKVRELAASPELAEYEPMHLPVWLPSAADHEMHNRLAALADLAERKEQMQLIADSVRARAALAKDRQRIKDFFKYTSARDYQTAYFSGAETPSR